MWVLIISAIGTPLLSNQVYDDQAVNDTGTLVDTPYFPEHVIYFVDGVFDGATLRIELSPDGVKWFPDSELTFTNATTSSVQFMGVIDVVRGVKVRGVLEDATGNTSIDLWIL